jgi:hypothetical protein
MDHPKLYKWKACRPEEMYKSKQTGFLRTTICMVRGSQVRHASCR